MAEFEGGNDLSGGVRARVAGQDYEARVMQPRGGPANPLSDDELRAKFVRNASLALPAERVGELLEALVGLDRGSGAEVPPGWVAPPSPRLTPESAQLRNLPYGLGPNALRASTR